MHDVTRTFMLTLACAGALPSPAAAHDPPYVRQVQWRESAGDRLRLWTNRGMITGTPGEPFSLLCNAALEVTSNEPVDIVETAEGSLLFSTSNGLLRSDDGGCNFTWVVPFEDTAIYALQSDPNDSSHLIAVTGDPQRGVQHSLDAGENWEMLATIPDGVYYQGLRIAQSAPEILYASGLQLGNTFTYILASSSDGGLTWLEYPLPLLDSEGNTKLLAVHPQDPQQVLLTTVDNLGTGNDRLLRTDDGGRTFAAVLEARGLESATYSADGSTVYVTGRDGLWISTDSGITFQKQAGPEVMSYAAEYDGALYAAGLFQGLLPGLDGLGISTDGGASFEPVVLFQDVSQQLACPEDSQAHVRCETLWADWQREFSPPTTPPATDGGVSADAGIGTADSDGGATAGNDSTPTVTGGAPTVDAPSAGATGGATASEAQSGSASDGCSVSGQAGARGSSTSSGWQGWLVSGIAILGLRCRRSLRVKPGTRSV